ncbi:MAG: BMP family ABC transporter substrate-binding protein [Deltaproteobacteria bacterium]|nr:BMP family ABC transporter substrate-binding protein [Deltaproteobacteria bacterium]
MTPTQRWTALSVFAAFATCALPARRADPTAAHATPAPGMRAVRIGLVFDVGGRGDKSFNDAAYAGLARARRELGATVEYVEPMDADDRVSALRLFAARGFDLVVGVGYMFSRDVDEVARDYPTVRFACVDYAPAEQGAVPDNVVGLGFREEEGCFLVGAAAALTSRSQHVGFVGGMDIPLIRKFEGGYRLGVRAVCPTCRVSAAYAGSTPNAFRDPARGEALASAQYAQGVDVIFHASGTTGHGVFVAAHRLRRLAIGVDADQYDEMPDAVLTSMIKRVDVAVFDTIRSVAMGQFPRGPSGIRVLGLAEGAVDWVSRGPHARHLSADTITRVEALRAQISQGTLRVDLSSLRE